jgi:hypothetical protein
MLHNLFTENSSSPSPEKTDWISSRTVQTLALEPGVYSFQIASGYYADFTFSVTPHGTVDYDASYDVDSRGFLAGRGVNVNQKAGLPPIW